MRAKRFAVLSRLLFGRSTSDLLFALPVALTSPPLFSSMHAKNRLERQFPFLHFFPVHSREINNPGYAPNPHSLTTTRQVPCPTTHTRFELQQRPQVLGLSRLPPLTSHLFFHQKPHTEKCRLSLIYDRFRTSNFLSSISFFYTARK